MKAAFGLVPPNQLLAALVISLAVPFRSGAPLRDGQPALVVDVRLSRGFGPAAMGKGQDGTIGGARC
jgi:hypothetical protein